MLAEEISKFREIEDVINTNGKNNTATKLLSLREHLNAINGYGMSGYLNFGTSQDLAVALSLRNSGWEDEEVVIHVAGYKNQSQKTTLQEDYIRESLVAAYPAISISPISAIDQDMTGTEYCLKTDGLNLDEAAAIFLQAMY